MLLQVLSAARGGSEHHDGRLGDGLLTILWDDEVMDLDFGFRGLMGGGSASETFSRHKNLQKWSSTSDEPAEKWCEVTTYDSPPKLLGARGH